MLPSLLPQRLQTTLYSQMRQSLAQFAVLINGSKAKAQQQIEEWAQPWADGESWFWRNPQTPSWASECQPVLELKVTCVRAEYWMVWNRFQHRILRLPHPHSPMGILCWSLGVPPIELGSWSGTNTIIV
mmetsp:Transcript_12265/g.19318  ORF Transcript_12265/g.19318 Transcript_12265/m.19318 type:complete len:129 (-) Transcript_12265:177-563(-)